MPRDSGNFCDDFFRRGFAYSARGIPDAALRQGELAAASASFGIETMQGDLPLFGREFCKVNARKFGGAVGMAQKNFAGVLERFHFCLDWEAQERANFGFV